MSLVAKVHTQSKITAVEISLGVGSASVLLERTLDGQVRVSLLSAEGVASVPANLTEDRFKEFKEALAKL